MAKTRDQKQTTVEFYKDSLKNSTGVLFTDNPGLKVNEVVDLKKKLSAVGAEFHVLKNRLFKIAAKGKIDEEKFVGANTAIFSSGDITETAKILKDFSKNVESKPTVKGGIIGENMITPEQAVSLADIPSREVLIAKVLYMFNSPLSGFAQTLIGVQRNFVYALNEVKNKKS